MNQVFEKLQPFLEKENAISGALTLMDWDQETLAPKASTELTAKIIGLLSVEQYNTLINDEVRAVLKELEGETELSDKEKGIIKELKRYYGQFEKIPPAEYQEYSELQAIAPEIWKKAKQEQDFSIFRDSLAKMIEFNKKFASYRAKDGEKLYDICLDDYEEGMTCEMLDRFFGRMKEEIVPLLRKVTEKNGGISRDFIYRNYDTEKQEEFCRFLAEYIGFDFDRGVLAESEHPFTTNMHNRDVRITSHYLEHNLESAMFSVIHEAGHGIYEMGVDDELTMTLVGQGASMAVHESQSRFYENIIGREEAFWAPIYEKLKAAYPEQLSDVTLSEYFHAINKAEPDLIRTESNELTYSLHVLVRYEIEKAIFENRVTVDELPTLWNRLYQEYLGKTPENDAEGILQDCHWSGGSFGYFPTYALGNAIAAQIFHQMKKELPFEECLRNGEVGRITEYLRKHIHRFGRTRTTNELLQDLMGEDFNPEYYVEYLKEKFTRIYGL